MDDYRVRLQRAGAFTTADLVANREGRLTERQRGRLQSGRAGQVIFLGVTTLLTLGLLAAAYRQHSLAGLALAVICAVAAFVFGVRLRSSWAPSGVRTYEGRIRLEDPDSIRAGSRRLFVGVDLHDALDPGRPHRVHFVPESGRVTSIDPVSDEA